jgi:hypothetical protein
MTQSVDSDSPRVRRVRALGKRNGYLVETVRNRTESGASGYSIFDAERSIMIRFGTTLDETERWVTSIPIDDAVNRARERDDVETIMRVSTDARSMALQRHASDRPAVLCAALVESATRVARALETEVWTVDQAKALVAAARMIDYVEPLPL